MQMSRFISRVKYKNKHPLAVLQMFSAKRLKNSLHLKYRSIIRANFEPVEFYVPGEFTINL